MGKKLKYGLKRKLNDKFEGRLGSIDIAYNANEDTINIGVALRADVNDSDLLKRIHEMVSKSLRVVASELEAEIDQCTCGENLPAVKSSKRVELSDILAMLTSDLKG